MDKNQVKSKILEYLDKNYNLSLYSQNNRRFLAEQLSTLADGGAAVNTSDATYAGDGKKLEGGDEFRLGGGVLTNYTREHQQKVDEEAFVKNTKKQMEESAEPSEKTKSNPSKKQLKKLSKSKVDSSK